MPGHSQETRQTSSPVRMHGMTVSGAGSGAASPVQMPSCVSLQKIAPTMRSAAACGLRRCSSTSSVIAGTPMSHSAAVSVAL